MRMTPMLPKTIALLAAALGLVAAACTPQPSGSAAPGDGGTPGAETGGGEGTAMAVDLENGKKQFVTCGGCHGLDGKGLPNLGKDLHNNAFLAGLTDAEALAFLKVGRDATDPLNTTGVAMPPKGGNPALTDKDLADIVAYVRTFK